MILETDKTGCTRINRVGHYKRRTSTLLESSRIVSLPELSGGAGISTLMRKKDARHFKGPDPSVSSGYKVLFKIS